MLTTEDRILYIAGPDADTDVIQSLNQYEIMPIRITGSITGFFSSEEELRKILEGGEYTHMFIYRMRDEIKENVKGVFEDEYVKNDLLYKVTTKEGKIFLERVK